MTKQHPEYTDGADTSLAQPLQRGGASHFAHSRAVVIGIDRYQHIRPLSTAVSDAARLAEFLREQHGYDDVLLLEDATRATLATELGERLATRTGEDDRLLLYFAGHGIALDGDDGPEGFLIPADAKADDRATFVAMADLYGWLNALPCRHLLVILDCCFAGAFTWYGRRHLAPIGATLYREHYDRFVREPAWQILTSAAHDQEALDVLGGKAIGARGEQAYNGARHSPFADALFAALQGEGDLIPKGKGDGVVTATELYLYLRQTVEVSAEEQAKHRQTPELWPFSRTRHGKGEFIFLVPGHGEPDLQPAPELTTENNPYRGLQSYDEKHAALFFGRRALIEKLAAAVDEHPLSVVLGASGTGKSSVVNAGVVPHLKQRTTEGARNDAKAPGEVFPTYMTLPPMRPGDAPLRMLEELVIANLPGSSELPGRSDPATFVPAAIDGWLAAHPDQRLLLVVDQVEELVTLCRDDATRAAFLQTLADLLAAHPDRVRVILTLRTDFEPQFQDSPLNGMWHDGRFVVPPMSQAELREVIEAPAAVRVLFFDPPALVDTLIDEVIQTPGALPLLSFTLEQLYLKYLDRQSQAQSDGVTLERALTRSDYEALGGVIGSLRRRADEVYANLPDDAHRSTMERVMLRMVAVEGGELARRRVMLSELAYAADAENARVQTVLDRLVSARLLVTGSMDVDGDGLEDTVVEPAHDALVAAWDKLLQWKRQAEDFLPLQRRLWQAAGEWESAPTDRQRGLLWDANPRLPQLEETLWPTHSGDNGLSGRARWARQVLWPTTTTPGDTRWLNQVEVAFVQASVKQRARGLRQIIAVTAAVLVALTGLTIFATLQANEANTQRDIAQNEQQRAETEAAIAQSRQLAAQSRLAAGDQLDTSVLLSAEALAITDTLEAESSLLYALNSNRRLAAYLRNHDDWVRVVAISPNNKLLVSGSRNGMLTFWDMGTYSPIYTLANTPAGADILAMAFDTASGLLAVASESKTENKSATVSLWDISMHPPKLISLLPKVDKLGSMAFAQDGTRLLYLNPTGVWGWEIGASQPQQLYAGNSSSLKLTALSTTGDKIALTDSSTVVAVAGLSSGTFQSTTLSSGVVVSLVFSPDNRRLAMAHADSAIVVWDTDTDTLTSLTGHNAEIESMTFSPDGNALISGGRDDVVYYWDLSTPVVNGEELSGHSNWVLGTAFSPDGTKFVSGSADTNVIVWHRDPQFRIRAVQVELNDEAWVTAFSPDGTQVAVGGKGTDVGVSNLATGDQITLADHEFPIRAVAFDAAGTRLASGDENGNIFLWTLSPQPAIDQRLHQGDGEAITRLLLTPDGKTLIATGQQAPLVFWNLGASPPQRQDVPLDDADVIAMRLSPDGQELLIADNAGNLSAWDLQNWKTLWQKDIRTDIAFAAFHPTGESIAWGGNNSQVEWWDIENETTIGGFQHSPNNRSRALAFSADGTLLASGSNTGEIVLWDTIGKQPVGEAIQAHDKPINMLAIDPGRQYLASASDDRTIALWHLDTGAWETLACDLARRNLDQLEWQQYLGQRSYHATCLP